LSASTLDNVELRELPGVCDAIVEGFIDDRNRVILAALCSALSCSSFFEIGTNRGRTAWTVARHNPSTTVYTLDLPSAEAASSAGLELLPADKAYFRQWDRGIDFKNTPEEGRIHSLVGDSATFDFSPYAGAIDLVYIDGSHSYSYVKNDTMAALRMLSPNGAIVWDDYPSYPGVYAYLLELGRTMRPRPFHIYETRMVVYSPRNLIRRLTDEEYATATVA
jgi:hypothetical protein